MRYYVALYKTGRYGLMSKKPRAKDGVVKYWGKWAETRAEWYLRMIRTEKIEIEPIKEYKRVK